MGTTGAGTQGFDAPIYLAIWTYRQRAATIHTYTQRLCVWLQFSVCSNERRSQRHTQVSHKWKAMSWKSMNKCAYVFIGVYDCELDTHREWIYTVWKDEEQTTVPSMAWRCVHVRYPTTLCSWWEVPTWTCREPETNTKCHSTEISAVIIKKHMEAQCIHVQNNELKKLMMPI